MNFLDNLQIIFLCDRGSIRVLDLENQSMNTKKEGFQGDIKYFKKKNQISRIVTQP